MLSNIIQMMAEMRKTASEMQKMNFRRCFSHFGSVFVHLTDFVLFSYQQKRGSENNAQMDRKTCIRDCIAGKRISARTYDNDLPDVHRPAGSSG